MKKIIVTGATGQIGTELVTELRRKYGTNNVLATGLSKPNDDLMASGPYKELDVTNKKAVEKLTKSFKPDTIFHLAGILSAVGEKNPELAWNVNINGLKNVLDVARDRKIKKIFWPSSIAAFGPTTPRDNTPQHTILEPTTIYGATKVAGELLCQYYNIKYGLDIRSLRYPGLISYKTPPGGGTTDYAVAMFFDAKREKKYNCFVRPDTVLPMMYMPDAISATIKLMTAPREKIKIKTSYNLTAMSFSAKEIEREIKKHIPDFSCSYNPDFRQKIADSWPKTINDTCARRDWGWKYNFDLSKMTLDMLKNIQ